MSKNDKTNNTIKNTQILIVEDSPSLNQLIVESLRKHGYTATGLSNGIDAIDFIAKNNDLIVVLDHILPDITGLDVMKVLADKEIKVPVIAITGAGNEKLAVNLLKKGAVQSL